MLVTGLRRSAFRYAAPLLAGIGIATAFTASYSLVSSWADVEHAMGSAAALLAPAVGAVTAWDADRERRSGAGDLLESLPRPQLARLAGAAAAAAVWTGAVLLVLQTALIIRASTIGLTGLPTVAALLPWSAVLLAVVLGATATALLPGPVAVAAAPTVVVLAFLAQHFPGGSTLAIALDPFRPVDTAPDAFDFVPLIWTTARLATAAATALALTAVLLLKARSSRTGGAAVLVTSAVLLSFAVMTVGNAHMQALQTTPARRIVYITSSRPDLQVRLLGSYAPIAPSVATRWSRVADLLADSPLAFTSLQQVPEVFHAGETPRLDRLMLDPSSDDPAQESVNRALQRMLEDSCATADEQSWLAVAATSVYLTRDFDSAPVAADPIALRQAVKRFDAMSRDEARRWFRVHAAAFSTCTLAPEALPR